jgi:thimet oligopeptidase
LVDYGVPTPAEIQRAEEDALARAAAIVAEVVAVPDADRTFANTLVHLEDALDILEQAQGRYGFMSYVAESAEVRAAADHLREALEKYEIELSFREDLYAAITAYQASPEAAALTGERKRLLEWTLRDYRRDGFGLPPEQRRRVRQLKERLVELGLVFQRNIDTYEDALWLSREELAGLPAAFVERLRSEQRDGQTLYRVSLDYPEMYPFLENAESEDLRRELLVKSYRRGGAANIKVLEEAIAVRDELARLLGYPSWADYVLEVRMAKTAGAARAFLADLREKVRPKLERDLALLTEAKRRYLGRDGVSLELWDWRFYHHYLLKTRYAIDDFEVAKYFPLDAVLRGLFHVYQTLLALRFEELPEANAWHPDVKLFRVLDAADGREVAFFYMDLFPRPNKYGHAAAFTLRGGRLLGDGSYQKPVSAIVANFTKPTESEPSLLRHSEVETLFHEFGHILHQTLTTASHLRFSGTRTERDFVEAPSQMLEHWVWQPEVLAGFTRHVETGLPIPKEIVDSLVSAKNLSSGVTTCRQLYFAELDMAYHGGGAAKDTTALARELHEISGFPAPPDTHWQSGFGHLFGYDAGYYGYKWSEVFADDMFSRFEAAGVMNADLGLEYRRKVLEPGGTLDGADLVRGFLGREPSSDAFLRNIGL